MFGLLFAPNTAVPLGEGQGTLLNFGLVMLVQTFRAPLRLFFFYFDSSTQEIPLYMEIHIFVPKWPSLPSSSLQFLMTTSWDGYGYIFYETTQ